MSGHELVRTIEDLPTDDKDRPLSTVRIVNCGELVRVSKKKKREKETSSSSDSLSDSGQDPDAKTKRALKKEKKKLKKAKKKEKKRAKRQAEEESLSAEEEVDPVEKVTEEEETQQDQQEPEIELPDFEEPRSWLDRGGGSDGPFRTFHPPRRPSEDKEGRKIKGRGAVVSNSSFYS